MSKAIFLKDMPAACLTCNGLGRLKGGFLVPDEWYCRLDCMAREIDDNSPYMRFGWPDWCPLVKLPERRKNGEAVGYKIGEPLTDELAERLIDFGYNECLDEIEIAAEGKHETD